jgi:hypothetical protein
MRTWTILAIAGAGLNLLDAVLTTYAIGSGRAFEANPLMAVLLTVSFPLFFVAKLLVVGLFAVLAANQEKPLARVGLLVGLASYIGIGLYHMLGLLF